MYLKALTSTIIIFLITFNSSYAVPPSSFSNAKKILNTKIYFDQKISFYCGCQYETKIIEKSNGKKRNKEVVNHQSCNFKPRKNTKRAQFVEWEHVLPAFSFGHQLRCWQIGGRKNCRKDATFNTIEADMHNLVPAIGEVNGDRSNFKYGMIEGEARVYGACDFEVDFKQKVAEPIESIRGDIARTYFYMRDTYKIRLSKQQTKLFEAWNKSDPVNAWECEKNKRIKDIQGNNNPYIFSSC